MKFFQRLNKNNKNKSKMLTSLFDILLLDIIATMKYLLLLLFFDEYHFFNFLLIQIFKINNEDFNRDDRDQTINWNGNESFNLYQCYFSIIILIHGNIHMYKYIDQCIQCMLINVQCFKDKSIFYNIRESSQVHTAN